MKSLHFSSGSLTERDTPQPQPQPGDVLIQVHAAGVTPTELTWYPTLHTKTGEPRLDPIPSHEFSGAIAALGDGVTGLEIGQLVYGMNDWFAEGALAEYCLTRPESIAPKPSSIDDGAAASVPISALTAWQGLFDRGGLKEGQRVLVHGGAGAVGMYAIQLARSRGAHVITTASARSFDFVRSLGANEVLDYQAERFETKLHDIDVVFDTVGGETLKRSWSVLKAGGQMVTVASTVEDTRDERAKKAFFIVEPKHQQLIEIAQMLDSGKLRAVVASVVPWPQASDAYLGKLARGGPGKIVVAI